MKYVVKVTAVTYTTGEVLSKFFTTDPMCDLAGAQEIASAYGAAAQIIPVEIIGAENE